MDKISRLNPDKMVSKWCKGRFILVSGFYAGRPPSEGDLDSRILQSFYVGIRNDIGEEEARNFVRFVNNLNDLSASSFIVAFQRFWWGGMRTVSVEQRKEDRFELSGRGNALAIEGMGAIFSAMFDKSTPAENSSTSRRIKRPFIQAHLEELAKEDRPRKPDVYPTF
ncbi:MAG TPA: hypothetical protein VI953_00480 [Candidatus Paceibacterota bacterium]